MSASPHVRAIEAANARALGANIALARAWAAMRDRQTSTIRATGLTPAQFAVLEALYHKGPLRVSEVTKLALATPGNMTVVVRNLERDGLIACERDAQDARSKVLALTQAGRELMEEYLPGHLRAVASAYGALDKDELRELGRLLGKLAGA